MTRKLLEDFLLGYRLRMCVELVIVELLLGNIILSVYLSVIITHDRTVIILHWGVLLWVVLGSFVMSIYM